MTASTPDPRAQERLDWLRRNMTSWLLTLLLLVVATVVGASYTFGLFASGTANPENRVTAGSMTQASTADNVAIMGAQGLVPGEQVEGSVRIRNEGDATGDFRLVAEDVVDDPGPRGGALSDRLLLRVEDQDSGEEVYAGRLDGLDVSLGSWQPDEERGYVFVVTFPDGSGGGDDDYQRSTVTATFVWNAVQAS